MEFLALLFEQIAQISTVGVAMLAAALNIPGFLGERFLRKKKKKKKKKKVKASEVDAELKELLRSDAPVRGLFGTGIGATVLGSASRILFGKSQMDVSKAAIDAIIADAPWEQNSGLDPFLPPPDPVQCTAFSPKQVVPKQRFFIKVGIHLNEQAEALRSRVQSEDPELTREVGSGTDLPLRHGDCVDVLLDTGLPEGEGASMRRLTWQGEPVLASFPITLPDEIETFRPYVSLAVNGLELADISWAIEVRRQSDEEELELRLERFRRVFLSYSSADKHRVKFAAAAYNSVVEHCFFDRDSLNSGDEFPEEIAREIALCDLFVLFWSKNAEKSGEVSKEMNAAITRWKASRNRPRKPKLSIFPVYLKVPQAPDAWGQNVHFTDRLLMVAGTAVRFVADPEDQGAAPD